MSEIWGKSARKTPTVYAFQYAYDLVGNRTQALINGVATYYFYDAANQLTVKGTNAVFASPTYYFYDKNGSLLNLYGPGQTGPTYFAYNAGGLVAKIRWKDSSSTYFFYDGNLQRYGIQPAGTPTIA